MLITLSLRVTSTSAGSRAIITRSRSLELVNSQPSSELSAPVVGPHENDLYADSKRKLELSNLYQRSEQHDVPNLQGGEDDILSDKMKRHLEHNFKYEPKPYYKQHQSQSSITQGQKIGLATAALLTIALAIYSCVLRYELSSLNVYSLLGMHTDTEQEDEEKVGDAYGRRFEMI
ncbi:hypothetical protein ACHAWX_000460 [Stephanocyclus meneghinianus]